MRLRDLVNVGVYRSARLLTRLQVGIQYGGGLIGSYTPDPFREPDTAPRRDPRDCLKRRAAILAALPDQPLTSLDIGCDIGFFTFALAGRGGLCIGVDGNRNAVMTARGLASLNGCANALFTEALVTPDNADRFPGTDVLICLSIFHHWVRHYGLEGGTKILKTLADKVDGYIVFDTGQSDETETSWAKELSFMGDDPESWTGDMLRSIGFADVRNLGKFSSAVSAAPRNLFIAAKRPLKHD